MRNQRGQMAVFVALIFQLLFVFFAMIINIGILVHDKINLQNSVDLAAIYAAQKQAEQLNAIAHMNYQIRQSWKLFVWRVAVLGDKGRERHPAKMLGAPLADVADAPYVGGEKPPAVCLVTKDWYPIESLQNLCDYSKWGIQIPRIPVPHYVPLPSPELMFLQEKVRDILEQARARQELDCNNYGAFNWHMAAKWYAAFKYDSRAQRGVISALANLMSRSREDFADLTGSSVQKGTLRTFRANLTRSNNLSLKDGDFRLFNSLGGIAPNAWLKKVVVFPNVFYVDTRYSAGGATACSVQARLLSNLPSSFSIASIQERYDPQSIFSNIVLADQDPENDMAAVVGFEKNPWVMAYVGVQATSRPRQPFAPFGRPITLTARAFARPFGGRIGPWYGSQWPNGSEISTGDPIDRLLPPRFSINTPPESIGQDYTRTLNYSRYPGDRIGIRSVQALGAARQSIAFIQTPYSQTFWDGGIGEVNSATAEGDILASSDKPDSSAIVRTAELAAITPDLFDITYYSIENNFYDNYVQTLAQFKNNSVLPRPDIGFKNGTEETRKFNIISQISHLQSAETNQKYEPPPYQIRDPGLTLTSWTQSRTQDYGIPRDIFGKCLKYVDDGDRTKPAHPGNCIAGGRTGYSVKMIGRDYLMGQDLELGGVGVRGPLLNPPPEDF